MADFQQIWSRNVFRCPVAESGKTFSKCFTLWVICLQNLKSKIGKNKQFTQSRLQVRCLGTGDFLRFLVEELGTPKLAQIFAYGKWLYPYRMQCREILFTPHCSPRVREFPISVNFSLWCTVAELGGIKVANFRILAYFPHTTPLKRRFRWPAYTTAQGLHRRMIPISPFDSRKSKGVPGHRKFSATSGRGAGDPQTCPNFRIWQVAISIQNATARRGRSGPKMSENAQL